MSNGEIKVNGEGGLRNETINFQFKGMLYGEMGKNFFPNLIRSFLKISTEGAVATETGIMQVSRSISL